MNTVLAIVIFSYIYYHLILFARQEHIEDEYIETISDVEGRLDWAHSRSYFPFGMRAQMEVSQEMLGKARNLWEQKKFQKAYHVALQSQEAIDRAQQLYVVFLQRR